MRKWLFNLLIVLALGLCGFVITSSYLKTDDEALLHDPEAELKWLQSKFDLTESQYANIAELHRAFVPRCEQMCMDLVESDQRIDRLVMENRGMTPQLQQALEEAAALDVRCRRNLLSHVYEVAAVMKPEQAEEYITMMRQRLSPHQTVQDMLNEEGKHHH